MRELDDNAVSDQAEALAQYIRRGGDEFVWLASKDFTSDDRVAVRAELRRQRVAQEGRSA